jgi:hypothetical protein
MPLKDNPAQFKKRFNELAAQGAEKTDGRVGLVQGRTAALFAMHLIAR